MIDVHSASKYGNHKTALDGYIFDSQAEAERYIQLRLLERAGEIERLAVHTRWKILDGFTVDGERYAPIYYEDDFSYYERDGASELINQLVVEDVKGVRTAVFRLKEKMFRQRFGDIDLRIIEAKRVRGD